MSSSGQRNKWQGLVRRLPDGKDAVYAGWTLELIATSAAAAAFVLREGLNSVALVSEKTLRFAGAARCSLAYEQRLLSKSGR
jgi:hypothetical protein